MVFYLNATIISLLIAGLACLVSGIVTFIRGYQKQNKNRIGRGWRLAILGTVITSVFLPILIKVLKQEAEGSGFLSITFFFLIFFLPLVFGAIAVCIIFFLAIGTTSLKEGYTKDAEGKFKTEDIILGYIVLALGAVVIFSLVMFVRASFESIAESIRNSTNKNNPSITSSNLIAYLNFIYK